MTNPRVFRLLNPLLIVLLLLNAALTLYCCAHYYTYLPSSDTWAYADFLAQASRGHLDISQLLAKHNGLHIIALPKLVYFLDAFLTSGSGMLTVACALLAMLSGATLYVFLVLRCDGISKPEKIFIASSGVTILVSASQLESLLNPANLQWSLLVFSAMLTAWCYSKKSGLGVILGIILVGLTSASPALMIIPLLLVLLPAKWILRFSIIVPLLLALLLVAAWVWRPDQRPLLLAASANQLFFFADFLVPVFERLHTPLLLLPAAAGVALASWHVFYQQEKIKNPANRAMLVLVLFCLVLIAATTMVRGAIDTAFTFRFVNISCLLAAALLPLVMATEPFRKVIISATLGYILLLSAVNIQEASAFGFGRNHIKLTQVAHALDINDPFVVSSMPGTIWEKPDFEAIQANKHLLQQAQTGIYASDAYRHVGLPVSSLENLAEVVCQFEPGKLRKLLPDQAAWRIMGTSTAGDTFSSAYFVDHDNIIRGFAIPVVAERNVLRNLFVPQPWAGFVNLENSKNRTSVFVVAYNNRQRCTPVEIALPEYVTPRKKKTNDAADLPDT